jgi:mono/diheme cytochrome c family protein
MAAARKLALTALALASVGGGAFWFLTAPTKLDAATVASMGEGDAQRGELVFWASGCASCHAAPGAEGDAVLSLVGGERFETEFGTFIAPNISQHPTDGIGNWTKEDLANAVIKGVSPDGQHYYPAFPYASYARMTPTDAADLYAFMMTLPAVEGRAADHELGFPFNMRIALGGWKFLYLDDKPAVTLTDASPEVLRGQYLVEGLGHCGECHTPRGALGGLDNTRWLAGAKSAEGDGNVPNITSGEGGIGDWSVEEIADLLDSGFTPDFDSVGGTMAPVVRNMAKLPAEDRAAMAAYLKAIPGHPDAY